MRSIPAPLLAAAACAAALLAAPPASAAEEPAKSASWVFPQEVKCAGRRLTLHEPRVIAYEPSRSFVQVRFPVLLTDPLGRSSFGMAEAGGDVHLDLGSRLLRIDPVQAGASAFPAAPEADAKAVQDALGEALPKSLTLRIELLTARPGAAQPETAHDFVKTPPAIVTRRRPAVLVQVDGDPVLVNVEELPLQYVANTASEVFFDPKASAWYLLVDGAWMQAKAMKGPWTKLQGSVPPALSQLPTSHPRAHIRKYVGGTPEFMKRGPVPTPKEMPEVIVADKPTELLLLAGDPLLAFVPGVRLMSIANTESDLFFHPKTNLYYLLVAGRWLSSVELEGPWSLVEELPPEFAQIPRDHVRGHVVWCVPGTPEAAEACAMARLEENATLGKYAPIETPLEGDSPVTAPLEGDVKLVTNTEVDCFAVGGAFYACEHGAWYRSENGRSSWKACDKVPEAIQKLSDKTPVQHVKSCRPVSLEAEMATYAITNGYYGVFPWRGAPVYGNGVAARGLLRNGNWYPTARTWGENRWYDPATGIFQPRSVRPRADGSVTADEWSPYTASYGRVVYYGCRYEQGGRRMFPYLAEELRFDLTAKRPNVWALWGTDALKKREGLEPAAFPFGDRAAETSPAEPRLAADETGRVWRLGAKGPESNEKGAWAAGQPAPEVVSWLETLARVDARPAQWKRWRDRRAQPIPVYSADK